MGIKQVDEMGIDEMGSYSHFIYRPIFESVGVSSLRKLVSHSGVQVYIARIGKI